MSMLLPVHVKRNAWIAVGVDVEALETDRIGSRSVGGHEVTLPVRVGGIG